MNWMNRVGRIGAVAGVVAIGAATARAEESGQAPKPRGEQPRKAIEGPRLKAPTTQPGSRRAAAAGERREGPLEKLHALLAGLHLTDAQKTQVQALLADAKEAHKTFREKHGEEAKVIQQQMQEAREAGDRAKARELGEKHRALMEGAPKPKEVIEKIRAVLAPDQQKEFDSRLEKMKDELMGDGPRKAPTTQPGDRREMRGEGKPERKHEKREEKKELDV